MKMARITAACCDAGVSPLARTVRVTCGVGGDNEILAGDWPVILVADDVPRPFVVRVSRRVKIAYGNGVPLGSTSLGQSPVRAGGRFTIGAEGAYEIERYYLHCNETPIARVTAECIDGCPAQVALTIFCVVDEAGRVCWGDWMGYETNGAEQLPFVLYNRGHAVFHYRDLASETTFRSSLVGQRFDVSSVRAPGPAVREFEVSKCEML